MEQQIKQQQEAMDEHVFFSIREGETIELNRSSPQRLCPSLSLAVGHQVATWVSPCHVSLGPRDVYTYSICNCFHGQCMM